jgi:hypothetical protein
MFVEKKIDGSATAVPYAARLDGCWKRQGVSSSRQLFGWPSRMVRIPEHPITRSDGIRLPIPGNPITRVAAAERGVVMSVVLLPVKRGAGRSRHQ